MTQHSQLTFFIPALCLFVQRRHTPLMSIPHSSAPTRGTLEVTGQRIEAEHIAHRRPVPIAVAGTSDDPDASPPARSRSHSAQRHSRSSSPPHPRWSPSGNEARFGADSSAPFSAAPDPREFLRRGTGEWAHTTEQPLSEEERWQQETAQREAAKDRQRSASPSPPRTYGPGEIPHAHQSPPHPRRRGAGWPSDRSTEPQVHRDFLRAHTGGHAHPNLQPVFSDNEPQEDFDLELSAEAIVEAREPTAAQARDQSESPLRDLSPPKPQRYPFKHRREQQGSPEPAQQQQQQRSASASPARPPPVSMPLHSHPLPVRPATAGPRPLPAPSTLPLSGAAVSSGTPLPGSTIASYIERFRHRPPQPPSAQATSTLPTFWWQTPAAAAAAASGSIVPPLPPPKQGISTAEHLSQMEQQIEAQRAEKRQQKLQAALAKEMRAQQQQQQQQQSHPDPNQSFAESQGGGGGSVGESSFADFSVLDHLESQDALQQPQHAAAAAAEAVRDEFTAQQPRQSILDDSDDFSALLAPSRHVQPPRTTAVEQSHSQSDVSALLAISPQRRSRPIGVVASPDVDELLRKWRAERAAGGTGTAYQHTDHTRERVAALLQPSLPASPAPLHTRASRLADSPASASVDALISNLKKRLGLDQPRAEVEEAMFSHVPLRDIENQQQQYHVAAHAIKRDRSTSPLASSRKHPSGSAASPPHARLTARLHGSVEEMMDRPKVAKQEYLDSARRAAAEHADQHEGLDGNRAAPAPALSQPVVVIPPLRLPEAVDASSSEPAAPAPPLPPASAHPSASLPVDAASAVHARSGLSAPAAPAVASSLPKADDAALLRLELQRLYAEKAAAECRGSHKKHRTHGRSRAARTTVAKGPRGVITIQITPIAATATTEAAVSAQPVSEATHAAAAASAAAEEPESKQPIPAPAAAAASSAPIESVHFVSNANPTVLEYILPVSPERAMRPVARPSQPSSPSVSLPRAVGGVDAAGSVREVVTRGLFCDASAYATIVSQLRPEAAAPADRSHEPAHGVDQEQKHQDHEADAKQNAATAVMQPVAAPDSHCDHPQQQQPQPLPPTAVAASSSALPPQVFPPPAAPYLQQPPVLLAGAGGAMMVQTPWGWAPWPAYAAWPQQQTQAQHPVQPPHPAMMHVAESSSAPSLFSPSHEHLARLCAELGMSVAEYYADPPLQALVRQLDALQRQQRQVQQITQTRMPLAH